MTVKYICMVDALYEHRSLFGKHQGRDILSDLGIFCDIILKWMFTVCMVTILCGVMHLTCSHTLYLPYYIM